MPCCAVLRVWLYLLFRTMPGIIRSIIPGAGTTGLYQVRVLPGTLLSNKNCAPSYSIAGLSCAVRCSAVPCGAVPCHAVPCLALRCSAVPCSAVLSFEHTVVPGIMRSARHQILVCTCVLVLFVDCSFGPLHVPPPPQVTPVLPIIERTRHSQYKRTAQHGATSSAQVPPDNITPQYTKMNQIIGLFFVPLRVI